MRPHPERDWFFLLVVMFAALIASAAWNFYLFTELTNGRSLGGAVQKAPPSQNVQVTDVQEVFKSRAAERDHYQNDYTFIDPSLPGS